MTTYICNGCHRAFYGQDQPKDGKIRLLLTCPGCGCHNAREASEVEDRIVRKLTEGKDDGTVRQRSIKTHA